MKPTTRRKDLPCRSGRSPDWLKMKNPDAPAVKRANEALDKQAAGGAGQQTKETRRELDQTKP
jgi:hypothetical protein